MFKLLDVLFGCSHSRYTFPRTAKSGSPAASTTGVYVVCLDCGREFPYDWRQMKVVPSPPVAVADAVKEVGRAA